jgi:hypothetical protein
MLDVFMYLHVCIQIDKCIHIYIYIKNINDVKIYDEWYIFVCIHLYIHIYIYIYTFVWYINACILLYVNVQIHMFIYKPKYICMKIRNVNLNR